MKDAIERIRALKGENAQKISNYRVLIEGYQSEIQMLECQAVGIEAALQTLLDASPGANTPPLNGLGKYAKANLTAAISDIVNSEQNGNSLLPSEIQRKLMAEGFQSDAKKLYASIYAVARRLASVGKISETQKDGKRAFAKPLVKT